MLTPPQFETLIFAYTQLILDDSTPEELHALCGDLLIREYENYKPEEIFKEIAEVYGEAISSQFLASATAD